MTTFVPRASEKTILIGLEHDGVNRLDVKDSLNELRQLAATAGANVVDTVVQRLDKPTAPYDICKGKTEAVARHPGSVAISVWTGEGMPALLAEIHCVGHVLDFRDEGDLAHVHAPVPPELLGRLKLYESAS